MIGTAYAGMPAFALRVVGNSMNRTFPEGSYVICVGVVELGTRRLRETGQPLEIQNGAYVVVHRRDRSGLTEATIKRYKVVEGQAWLWPESTDPAYQQPWPVPNGNSDDDGEDLVIAALVVSFSKPIGMDGT